MSLRCRRDVVARRETVGCVRVGGARRVAAAYCRKWCIGLTRQYSNVAVSRSCVAWPPPAPPTRGLLVYLLSRSATEGGRVSGRRAGVSSAASRRARSCFPPALVVGGGGGATQHNCTAEARCNPARPPAPTNQYWMLFRRRHASALSPARRPDAPPTPPYLHVSPHTRTHPPRHHDTTIPSTTTIPTILFKLK